LKDVRAASNTIYRGNIVFTELNHGYINPTADRHAEAIVDAIKDTSFWAGERARGSYGSPLAIFNEYMNWGLVALRYLDRASAEDQEELLSRLDRFMGEQGRGFLQFAALRPFLVDSYLNRAEGETIADLYPAIIEWFANHEASAARTQVKE
jgi:hypothetical protein